MMSLGCILLALLATFRNPFNTLKFVFSIFIFITHTISGDTLDVRSERKASHTEHTEAGIIIETPYEDTDSGVTGGDNLSISESVTEYTIEKTALCQNNNEYVVLIFLYRFWDLV